MFCKNCGNEMPVGAKFCGICGNPVAGSEEEKDELTEATTQDPPEESKDKKHTLRNAIIAIIVCVAVVVVLLIAFLPRGKDTDIIDTDVTTDAADSVSENEIALENEDNDGSGHLSNENSVNSATDVETYDNVEDDTEEHTGRWNDDGVTDDGVVVMSERTGYSDEEISALEDAAEAAADEFCYTVFNYSTSAGSSVTAALSDMLMDENANFDTPEAFDEVFSGTNTECTFYWYEPACLFISYSDTYGDCINTFGLARVHMASEKIAESDYDVFLQLSLVKLNDEWKIYYILTGDMYLPGEGTVVQDEEYNWIIDVDIDPVTSFDITNPEGYLTDYMYDRYEGS